MNTERDVFRSAPVPQEPDARWGSVEVDPFEPSLPGLKARFLVEQLPRRGKVLEVGSGEGKLLRTLARHLPQVELHGCDVRPPATASEVYTFHLGVEGQLPFQSGDFDAVVVADVLEHVEDPRQLLTEIRRVLRRGGELVAFVPIEGEPRSVYAAFRRLLGPDLYARTKEHRQAFTHAQLQALVGEHFRIQRLEYAYHALGHAMDATFFAAAALPRLRRFWWTENVYYHRPSAPSALSRVLNRWLTWGNRLAYLESKLLAGQRWASAGVLFRAAAHE